ncbi:MAG: Membrane-bound lytic murein transglycosylase D precursor (EC [uncultured Thiotrichaceae bacterium]|uniref:Membrane-bound lytic murein transglycosylase D (EC) n=1 Tax=uncultured Thiotrichaceae bacterium TaxID=298394 RepID=A0A6S6UG33_9GAMM|nr:MAG: Membrane-bound lytic murein transglycosylase D precursor (EC [uncultured Thiotrichaceae bacterium]
MITRKGLAISTATMSSILGGCSGNIIPAATPKAETGAVYSNQQATPNKLYIQREQKTSVHVRPKHTIQLAQQLRHKPTPSQRLGNGAAFQKTKARHHHFRQATQNRQNWQSINRGFNLPRHTNKSLVKRYIRSFSKSPVSLKRMAHRASPHLPYIISEIQRRGMPMEIALLPFVESAYKTNAYSHAHAAGLWQFIPETGRRYGLRQTRTYDARMNPKLATNAALNYLQDLNQEFNGDWLLSLAAYNCGENRVHREIARNKRLGKPTSYWHLRLPKETRQYVPRLFAYKELYSQPTKYGISMPYEQSAMYAAVSTPQRPVPYRHMDVDLIKASQTLLKTTEIPAKTVVHRIRSGDTLTAIAKKYGTSIDNIMKTNGLRSSKIIVGEHLKIVRHSSVGASFV